jgi:hypothetical protein
MTMIDDRTRRAHKRLCKAVAVSAPSAPKGIPPDVWQRAVDDYDCLIRSGAAATLRDMGWNDVELRALACFIMGRRIIALGSEVVGFDDDKDDAIIRPRLWYSGIGKKGCMGAVG